MKVPLEWLQSYVDLPESLDELVHRLIMSGTEVEEIIRLGEGWNDVVIGQVTSKEIPEGSRHLSLVTLDLGSRSAVAVTGAPNIETGQHVPVVLIGGTIPCGPDGEPFVLQPRKMMGITGEAMVLSERELGMSDEHGGILVLPDTAEVGRPLSSVLGGVVLDVEAKGRPDELAMFGVAREIAAVTRNHLREPDTSVPTSVVTVQTPSAVVEVWAPDLCPRFSVVRIDGICIGPSPDWLSRRLEAAGVRSINNAVDATNYVMLELGQPLHAYDRAAFPEATFIVRRARKDERIVTLDGVERALNEDVVLVTDPTGPTGIGGIMGGGNSEIREDTTSILLEGANWNRVNIRRSSRFLGLRTEASARFERGVPEELTKIAILRTINVLAEVNEGPLTAFEVVDVRTEAQVMPAVEFTTEAVERLLGVSVPTDAMLDALRRLGFETSEANGRITAVPPYWRSDVEASADIAEEVARMIGYDGIPESLPGQETQPLPLPPELGFENRIREILWGVGVSEAWTDSLTSPGSLSRLSGPSSEETATSTVTNLAGVRRHGASAGPIPLANAPSLERSVLRNTLVPSLLDVAARNLKHTREGIAFFEIARTFFPREADLPYERRTLAIVVAGDRWPRIWNRPNEPYDFFDLKGVIGAVLAGVGSHCDELFNFERPRHEPLYLHPWRSATIRAGADEVGVLGEMHPLISERFEIHPPVRALVAELDLDALIPLTQEGLGYAPVSRYPAVKRDIALTFPIAVEAAFIERLVRQQGGALLRAVRIVDVYSGEELGPDRRSIAIGLEFQSDTETLTTDAVSVVQDSIVKGLTSELQGVLRT